MSTISHKITPFLWFSSKAEDAMKFYVSIFNNSKILSISPLGEGMVTGEMELDGQRFMVMGVPTENKFNESISLFVNCETQEEVDELWEKFTADGGEESKCGWLKDKFGVSWQIIHKDLGGLIGNPDPVKAKKAMDAMLKMSKIDINVLREAAEQ